MTFSLFSYTSLSLLEIISINFLDRRSYFRDFFPIKLRPSWENHATRCFEWFHKNHNLVRRRKEKNILGVKFVVLSSMFGFRFYLKNIHAVITFSDCPYYLKNFQIHTHMTFTLHKKEFINFPPSSTHHNSTKHNGPCGNC